MEEDDENALLFSLVHKLPANLAELTYMVNESNASVILECGLMRHIPLLLRDNFSSALALLHKIHQNDVQVDEFFFRKETTFFFTEKVYWILRGVYCRPTEGHEENGSPQSAVGPSASASAIELVPFSGSEGTTKTLITEYRDNNLQKIIELFTSFIKGDKNTYLLDVLFDVGYFHLINCVNTREVWVFYNTIFYFKLGSAQSPHSEAFRDLHVENRYTSIKSDRQELVIEITRRQFDTEVVMNKRIIMRYRKFVSKYRRVEQIYRKIASEVHLRSLPMCSIALNTLYSNCNASQEGNERPLHLLNYIGVGYLSEVKDLPDVVGYLNMLKGISSSPNKKLVFKTVYRPDILKRFASPEFELNGIDMLYTANELHKEIEMECVEAVHKMNEEGVRYLMRSLEYAEYGPCSRDVCWLGSSLLYKVMQILKDTLKNNREWLFFKISYLLLMRSAALMLSEHTCSASTHTMDILGTLCQKILANLKRNPYNFARMLFTYKKGKRTKSSSAENLKEKHRSRKKSMDDSGSLLHGTGYAEGDEYEDVSEDRCKLKEERLRNGGKTESSSEDSVENERKIKLKRILDQKKGKENETRR